MTVNLITKKANGHRATGQRDEADFITLLRTGPNLKLIHCLFMGFSTKYFQAQLMSEAKEWETVEEGGTTVSVIRCSVCLHMCKHTCVALVYRPFLFLPASKSSSHLWQMSHLISAAASHC